LGLGGAPVLQSIRHLGDENIFHERGCDERTRRVVAEVDPGDKVCCYFGFGDDGGELFIPPAVALKDKAEILVVVDEFNFLVEQGQWGRGEPWSVFVGDQEDLCLGERKV
jgi:hypothetical protein